MRVALIAPVWFPVPPPRYGGIERVVALLADGLVERGHHVTLFAAGESRTRAHVVYRYDEAPSARLGELRPELEHAAFALARLGSVDVVHDHTGPLGAALGGLVEAPFVHTVHGPVNGDAGELYDDICTLAPHVRLIAISDSQRALRPALPWLATCHNALDLREYPFSVGERRRSRSSYLLFLGRMGEDKGAHRAIEVARAAHAPLVIAAKCVEPDERRYFEERVRPMLDENIRFVGEVGQRDKLSLLRGARALLHPIEWEEPFGLVMVEAMACGTPVVAVRRGSVPEVVEQGRGGIAVESHHEMPGALLAADRLHPAEIRRVVEERFSPERLVARTLRAYDHLLRDAARPARRGAGPHADGGGGLSSA